MRNFLRIIGGSIGLTSTCLILLRFPNSALIIDSTVSGAILNNVLRSKLSSVLPEHLVSQISTSAHDIKQLGLSATEIELVNNAYMNGIHSIFIMFAPIIAICFVIGLLVRDNGVAEKDATPREVELAAPGGKQK